MTYKVDIGIACGGTQIPNWWNAVFGRLLQEQQRGVEIGQFLAIGSALPDHNKNYTIGDPVQKRRLELTDANRQVITHGFMEGAPSGWKADYIFWIDDDTVFPDATLSHLLSLGKDFVAGLYFNANPPYNPIAYFKNKTMIGYSPLYNYPRGSLMQVDSVGMGCTLIHRRVYEAIRANYRMFQRPNGSLFPIHKDDVKQSGFNLPQDERGDFFVHSGWAHMKVVEIDKEDDRAFPYYSMEYGRTEDHHFCEMAVRSGFRPWVDTTIECEHWKYKATVAEQYHQAVLEKEGLE
jgi:hypothetical protein